MPSRSTRSFIAAVVLAGIALAGCGAATSPSASDTPTATPGPSSAIGGPTGSLAPSPPAQADTAWGRIWEGLPPGFPTFSGAEPTEVGANEPASATLDIPAPATLDQVVSFYRSSLEAAGYSVSVDGPLENGGYTISATGPAGCAAQVSVEPLGSSVTVTVLYGASCPFE
jgi:hypothetical protein